VKAAEVAERIGRNRSATTRFGVHCRLAVCDLRSATCERLTLQRRRPVAHLPTHSPDSRATAVDHRRRLDGQFIPPTPYSPISHRLEEQPRGGGPEPRSQSSRARSGPSAFDLGRTQGDCGLPGGPLIRCGAGSHVHPETSTRRNEVSRCPRLSRAPRRTPGLRRPVPSHAQPVGSTDLVWIEIDCGGSAADGHGRPVRLGPGRLRPGEPVLLGGCAGRVEVVDPRAVHTLTHALRALPWSWMITYLRALLPLLAPLVSGQSDVAIGSRLGSPARSSRGRTTFCCTRSSTSLHGRSMRIQGNPPGRRAGPPSLGDGRDMVLRHRALGIGGEVRTTDPRGTSGLDGRS
jgi:hypothetical protein